MEGDEVDEEEEDVDGIEELEDERELDEDGIPEEEVVCCDVHAASASAVPASAMRTWNRE